MMLPNSWGALQWMTPAIVLTLLGLAMIAWTYFRTPGSTGFKCLLAGLKLAALGLLALCLLEPMIRYTRPEPGANLMVVMADDSQSLQIKDRGAKQTRAARLKSRLTENKKWLERLENDFDVRHYQFNRQLKPTSDFSEYVADKRGSAVFSGLKLVTGRFADRPTAGVMLMTDGNATDTDLAALSDNNLEFDWEKLPPIYPVVVGQSLPAKDLSIRRVTNTQTNFELAPVTVTAELVAIGYSGKRVIVKLLDQENKVVDTIEVDRLEDNKPFAVRFKTRPEKAGVSVYHIQAFVDGEEDLTEERSPEATLVNNRRTVVVDRNGGPYRILYVAGRPNWELKFLRRALQSDDELDLVSLVRIAKRQPKFVFRGRRGQDSNPLFRGFDNEEDDSAEQHDEPVFIRIGTRDGEELRGGFPDDAETLFEYDAIVLDDIEAKFFTQDQKTLIQEFVSKRGGGLLMLGGQESFASGDYDHTPIGDMMPIYMNRISKQNPNQQFKMGLTREGWLQPWIRMESTEDQEHKRLASMPGFRTLNLSRTIKPGATVLTTVTAEDRPTTRSFGQRIAFDAPPLPGDTRTDSDSSSSAAEVPALVTQPFGRGRTAALLIGDMWRWQLASEEKNDDLFKAWRQTLRWLVSDVPRRTSAAPTIKDELTQTTNIRVMVNDEVYRPFDNAQVNISVRSPDGKTYDIDADASESKAGEYESSFVCQTPGAYLATVTSKSADGTEIETRESGWVSQPESQEFESLTPNLELLELLAEKTGGEVIHLDELDSFVSSLNNRQVPITETKSDPWWHHWTVFMIALGLLVSEWGLRRWKGLP